MDNKDYSNAIKRESIIGLPVIESKTGRKLGVVQDFYAGGPNTHLEGMYVAQKGFGKKSLKIPFRDVTIGYSSVTTEGNAIEKVQDNGVIKGLLKKRIILEDGRELGTVSDIVLDPLTGEIRGLELSESVIDDLITGRHILPYQAEEHSEGDVIIVTMEQADSISSYNKGIKNIFLNKI